MAKVGSKCPEKRIQKVPNSLDAHPATRCSEGGKLIAVEQQPQQLQCSAVSVIPWQNRPIQATNCSLIGTRTESARPPVRARVGTVL